MVGVCIGLAGEFIYLLFGDTPLHCVYVFGVEVVELKIIESSIACDYMVIQLNFFWTSLPDALGLSLPIQTNTICTTNQNQNLIYRRHPKQAQNVPVSMCLYSILNKFLL